MKPNSPEAKAQRRQYERDYPSCQVTLACAGYVNFGHLPEWDRWQLTTHHIWGRKSHLSEIPENYVTARPAAHEWCHEHLVQSRIALTSYKLDLSKTDDTWPHFDRDALREAAGYDVIGWVSNHASDEELPEWCSLLARNLVFRFRDKQNVEASDIGD